MEIKKISLYDLSLKITEKEYRELPSLSQSTLSTYEREGFSKIPTLFEKVESPSLLFGSVVDCLVTSPDEFNSLFVVESLPKLSDSLDPIMRDLFRICYNEFGDKIPDTIIHEVCDRHNYYSNPKFHNARLKKVREEGMILYKALARVGDKTLIDQELYDKAVRCVDAIKSSYAANYFYESPFEDINVYHQLKFEGEYDGIKIKGMLDSVVVDHKNKLIIPVDLKTGYKPSYNFPESYVKWGYSIQSNMYTYLLEQNILTHEDYKGYRVTDFIFIQISPSDFIPLVWKDIHNKSMLPLMNSKGEVLCRNWRDILRELNGYLTNNADIPNNISKEKPNNIHDFL